MVKSGKVSCAAVPGGLFRERIVRRVEENARLLRMIRRMIQDTVYLRILRKVDRRQHIVLSQRMSDGSSEEGIDGPLVVESDLGFGRVDVDVDARRVDVEVEEIARVVPFGDQPLESGEDSAGQIGTLDETAVDEQELLASLGTGILGFVDETADLDDVGVFLDRDQLVVGIGLEDGNDPSAQSRGGELVYQGVVAVQFESQFGVGKGHTDEFVRDAGKFDRVGLEKVSPGRDVEKQILYRQSRADGRRERLRFFILRAFDADAHPQLVFRPARGQFDLGNGGDRGQGFTPEAFGMQVKEILGRGDFRGGMPQETVAGIGRAHSAAVVRNLDQLSASLTDGDNNVCSRGIDRVFHELLYYRSGALHHFSRSNLVGDVIRQYFDNVAHACFFPFRGVSAIVPRKKGVIPGWFFSTRSGTYNLSSRR